MDRTSGPAEHGEPLRILIVEDDMIVGTHISMVLAEAGYDAVGVIPTGETALQHIRLDPPDLVLMDVQLKGKMDGVDTAKTIYEQFRVPVIFLTANSDEQTFSRAREAFPSAFISKPFRPADLLHAISLVADQLHANHQEHPASDSEQESEVLSDRIFVRDKQRMVKLFLKDIGYVEAERNYCNIHLPGKAYLLSVPLKTLESRLPSQMFVRTHRSFLVNLTLIESLDEHYVYVGDTAIPVSKSHKEALHQRLNVM